jgi:hypothetical protein
MGAGRPPHQRDAKRGRLVPYGPVEDALDRALLPYEQELIRILGCSESEYRDYVREVQFKSRVRPAEYQAVPDIQNGPVAPILISLVIGIASTVAGALLAPKPPSPLEQGRRGKNIRLASQQGSERFGATSGFDSINDLATYAEPIPIVFARRESGIGGVLAGTQLVWSRAFSYGNEQGVKLLFVIGEQGLAEGLAKPDLPGIFLGTTPLSGISPQKFAFYWNRNTNVNGRILAKNFAYGTRARADAGDPQTNDDIFLAPSRSAVQDIVFAQTYTPSSNTEFGCYASVANGTGYRVNFELVPLPDVEGNSKSDLSPSRRRRIKISGNFEAENLVELRALGQKGTGREYCRWMGITSVNGQKPPGGPDGHKQRYSVSKGSQCVFEIRGKVIDQDRYWTNDEKNDVNVDDINNATIRMREEADDLLQVGQIVMIARTVWVVKSRSRPDWGSEAIGPFVERNTQVITLECLEVFATGGPGSEIGAVSELAVDRAVRTDDQGRGTYTYGRADLKGLTVGPGYYPLQRVSFGLVRNTRPCDTTEVGLKSQVWNRADGLCNFTSLPTSAAMRRADKRGDTLNSGTLNLYFNRTSVFTVFIRPAGAQADGTEFPWTDLGEQFCIQGSRPVDQYNFIRFIHPQRGEYEFRFIPKNGADVAQNSPDSAEFLLLDARLADFKQQGVLLNRSYNTRYGTFGIQTAGRTVLKGDIEFAPELSSAFDDEMSSDSGPMPTPDPAPAPSPSPVPEVGAATNVFISAYFPDFTPDSARATSVQFIQYDSVPSGTQFRESALFFELWGRADFQGLRRSATRTFPGLNGGRSLTLRFDGVVNGTFPASNPFFPNQRAWTLERITVVDSSLFINEGDIFNCRIDTTPGNPRNPNNYVRVGVQVRVNGVSLSSGEAGRENGYSFGVLGNADRLALGTVSSTIRTLTDAGRSVQIRYSATVVPATERQRQDYQVNQVWDNETVEIIPGTSSTTFNRGVRILDAVPVASNNPFRPPGSQVGIFYQISAVG